MSNEIERTASEPDAQQQCPPWCAKTHLVAVHQGRVGEVEVNGGERVFSVEVQRDDRKSEPKTWIVLTADAKDEPTVGIAMSVGATPAVAALLSVAVDALTKPAADPAWFDADEPLTWRWENEADRVEPEGVTEVVDGDDVGDDEDPDENPSNRWHLRDDGKWTLFPDRVTSGGRTWADVLMTYGPLTEVVPPAQDGADLEDLRETYAGDAADQDGSPTEAGFQAWLARRGGAR